jgi:esterase/lipase superfamily enzyme
MASLVIWTALRRGGALSLLAMTLAACSSAVGDVRSRFDAVGDVFSSAPAQPPRLVQLFVASTRGERGAEAGSLPDGQANLSLLSISIPTGHRIGEIERASLGAPDPVRNFAVTGQRKLDETSFYNEVATHLSGRVGSSRDVLLYVHGFNTSAEDARFRLAQIVADGRFGGLPVLFSWPASSTLLDYEAAKESATASRDALAHVLRQLAAVPDVGRVHVLAHSMGTWLAMEALREAAIAGSPDLNGKLGDVVLAAPDIDLSVFRAQLARVSPSHVSILISAGDRALSLSRLLAGDRPRVGALDARKAADRAMLDQLGVKVYDLSKDATGLIGHGTYADAPAVVQSIGAQIGAPRLQDADVQANLGERPVDPAVTAVPLPNPPQPSPPQPSQPQTSPPPQ